MQKCSTSSGGVVLLSSKVSPAPGLEVDDDLSELDVSLFLKLGQHSGSEEHLGVTNTVGGGVKVKRFQLKVVREQAEENDKSQRKNFKYTALATPQASCTVTTSGPHE